MTKQTYTARITKLDVRHFSRRNLSGQCAKMSLWAETDSGDIIWLLTTTGLDTRRIENKLEEIEREYAFMIGQEVKYVRGGRFGEIGFLRPRTSNLESYRERAKQEQQSPDHYINAGEGI